MAALVQRRLGALTIAVAAVTLLVTSSGLPDPSAAAATSTSMTYRAVQSAYVSSAYPTKNFVGSKVLYTSSSPVKTSYLTFDLTGVPATIQSASLQVWVRTSSSRGFAVHAVSAPWSDSTITYRNAPSYGPTVATSGAFTRGRYVSVGVTSLAVGVPRLDLALTSTDSESFNGIKAGSAPRLVLSVDPPPVTPQLCGTGAAPTTTYDHVVWIWMENHNYTDVVGSSAAPFVNNTLIAGCGLATNYHNLSHPSLPNYLGASQGSVTVSTDCLPAACPQSAPSLYEQVATAGLTWKAYQESMPTACQLGDADPYEPKHNPPVYYPTLGASCAAGDVAMGTPSAAGGFADDLASGALPSFSFVTPNECDDGHDCPLSTADAWLSYWFPRIAASPAYSSTVVFLTWDEGSTRETTDCSRDVVDAGCHVATVVIAPGVVPGTSSSTLFNHYSLLATTEELLGLPDRLGLAGDPTTTTMTADFGLLTPPPAP